MSVVRISRGSFDFSRSAQFEAMLQDSAAVLVPALRKLKGLKNYYAGIDSASGTMINVSVWDTVDDARQMDLLPEMAAAGKSFAAAGVQFERPIINYSSLWSI